MWTLVPRASRRTKKTSSPPTDSACGDSTSKTPRANRVTDLDTGIPFDDLLARTDPPDPAEVLAVAGWQSVAVTVEDLEHRYARPLQIERHEPAPESQRGGFVTARLD